MTEAGILFRPRNVTLGLCDFLSDVYKLVGIWTVSVVTCICTTGVNSWIMTLPATTELWMLSQKAHYRSTAHCYQFSVSTDSGVALGIWDLLLLLLIAFI